ncbi:MAG: clostripain-related cysteine peptidase [Phocaeicola sp.]
MSRFPVLFLGLLLLVSCSDRKEIPSPPVEAGADRTLLAYFVANNDLESALRTNVVAMCQGLATMDTPCELLIYWDGVEGKTYWPTTSLLRYRTDGDGTINGQILTDENSILAAAQIVKEYPSQLASDKEVVMRVVQDMIHISPSSSYYGLVFGSHGSGWLKHINGANSRALGPDGVYANSITIPDLADALQSAGTKFDFILLDACMMASAEVLYDIRKVANYGIASVLDVPGPGFPYDKMLKELMEFSSSGYEKACQVYIDFYTAATERSIRYGTMSLIDCSEMENLSILVEEQIEANLDKISTYDHSNLQFYGRSGFKLISADLLQFIRLLNDGIVPEQFQDQFDRTVLYADYVKNPGNSMYAIDGSNYCGMGMYLPMLTKLYWNEYFQTLDWYKDAGWSAVTWPLP